MQNELVSSARPKLSENAGPPEVLLDNELIPNPCNDLSKDEIKHSHSSARVSSGKELATDGENGVNVEENKESNTPVTLKITEEFARWPISQNPLPFLQSEVPERKEVRAIEITQTFPTVVKAELAGNFFTKHVSFVIALKDGNKIKRRYSDFLWLRDWLKKTYYGAFIPPLPERLVVAKWPRGYLQTRMRELQVFLKRCSSTPFIAADGTWMVWLKTGSFDKVKKKWDKDHRTSTTTRETCELLATTFPRIMEWPLNDLEENARESRFQEMKEFVDDSLDNLQNILDSTKRFIETFKLCRTDSDIAMRDEFMEYETLTYTRFKFETTDTQERLKKMLNKTPAAISKGFVMWAEVLYGEPTELEYWMNSMKLNVMDFNVMKKCISERIKVVKQLHAARIKAAKWKKLEELRSKDLAQKHADEMRQDDLELLSETLYKLMTKQFIYVWRDSQHRFSEFTKRLVYSQAKKYHLLSQIWQTTVDLLKESSLD